MIREACTKVKRMNPRKLMTQGVQLGLIVTTALMIWKCLMLVTGSESPVVVVLSYSMAPGLHRGDILFFKMGNAPISTGEILMFNIEGKDIPIVHRVIKLHSRREEEHIDVLTKGDGNFGDDRAGIYADGQQWLHQNHILGRCIGFLPQVGMVTIVMNDHPCLKYALIGILGLLVVTNKDKQNKTCVDHEIKRHLHARPSSE